MSLLVASKSCGLLIKSFSRNIKLDQILIVPRLDVLLSSHRIVRILTYIVIDFFAKVLPWYLFY